MSKIFRMRKYKGLTQSDVAKKFGISLQAYSRKERGITPFTDSEKMLLKNLFIDDFPDVTMEELFFEDEVAKVVSREGEK